MNISVKAGDILFVPSREQANRGSIYLLGAVPKPGPVPLPLDREITVAQAVLQAGGVDQFGNDKKVRVLRDAPDGSKQTITVNIARILDTGLFEEDLPLQPGDVVIVPEKIISL